MAWLWVEVRDICNELGIPDINDVAISKGKIKKAIFEHHYNDMMTEISKSTGKLEPIKNDNFKKV